MAHGIQDYDTGYVFGTTWHNLPQYIQLDRPVTIEEAEQVFDYPMEKVPLYRINEKGDCQETGCYSIIRTDKDILLTPGKSVGNRFVVESNLAMLRRIDEFILAQYPDLQIESVGTLFNGQTSFISLKVSEYAIKGDNSATETNLLWSNPLGKGSYLCYAHSTRVVCNNTLTMSYATGKANKSMKKFSHTKNAGQKIKDHLVDLSETFLGMSKHRESMEYLAGESINTSDLNSFMDQIFPLPKNEDDELKKGRGLTVVKNARQEFLSTFEFQRPTMEAETASSKYGLLQAYTDYIDHDATLRSTSDNASVLWDSITGTRAGKKEKAMDYLLTANN